MKASLPIISILAVLGLASAARLIAGAGATGTQKILTDTELAGTFKKFTDDIQNGVPRESLRLTWKVGPTSPRGDSALFCPTPSHGAIRAIYASGAVIELSGEIDLTLGWAWYLSPFNLYDQESLVGLTDQSTCQELTERATAGVLPNFRREFAKVTAPTMRVLKKLLTERSLKAQAAEEIRNLELARDKVMQGGLSPHEIVDQIRDASASSERVASLK